MFKKTRRKLVTLYSSMIGCILTLMVVLFYIILSYSLSYGVENQLNSTSKMLIKSWKIISPSEELANPKRQFLLEERFNKGVLQEWEETYINYSFVPYNQFFILKSSDGRKILLHSLQDGDLYSFLKKLSPSSLKSDSSTLLITVPFEENRTLQMNEIPIKFLDDAVLYIGMETTDNINLLRQMRWLLIGMALVFLVVSIGIGYWFSGRTMIPIKRSYQRQQNFVADASHEFRTPLSILQASIEILEEEEKVLPPFHRKVLVDMKKESMRMTRMMEGLLTLARGDSGRVVIVRTSFDIKKMIETTMEVFKLLADQQQIQLTGDTAFREGESVFYGDEERLKQSLFILLDNACKYNKPGGKIHLELRKNAHDLFISVSDTGIGIPQEEIPYIFERFYRVDKGRSRTHGGTGLGLSIAAWIVEAHGGKINVSSQVGIGTTIRIILPLSRLNVE